jgi:hypothetical protein
MFWAHKDDWGFESFSYQSLDADSQPFADACLTRVSTHLAEWADTLPDDLLTLTVAMAPA